MDRAPVQGQPAATAWLESARQAAVELDTKCDKCEDLFVESTPVTIDTLKIVTWNVWFDGFSRFTRWAALLEEIFRYAMCSRFRVCVYKK